VLYCTSAGDPAGTLAIWSYAARDLCSTTSFGPGSGQGDATSSSVTFSHNDVGTITTETLAVPLMSSKYTVAGPDWYPYEDWNGGVLYSYNGTNPQADPVAYSFKTGFSPCGTPFALVIGNQIGTVTVPQCDVAGDFKGWDLGTVGYFPDSCVGSGISDTRVYIDAGVDSANNPVINANITVAYF